VEFGRKILRNTDGDYFAFLRAVVQGMSPIISWNRYLFSREGAATVLKIKHVFYQTKNIWNVASMHHCPPVRLLPFSRFLQSEAINLSPSELLEDFIFAHNLEDFSEVEQLQLFHQKQQQLLPGTSARQQVRIRVERRISQQLTALDWLQQHQHRNVPSGNDLISAWIGPRLATHLAKASLVYFHQLIEHIHRTGPHWWIRISGIGPAKATQIIDLLPMRGELCGISPSATAILPLEKWLLATESIPSKLGMPRLGSETLVEVGCDAEAIRSWLHSKQPALHAHVLNQLPSAQILGWEMLKSLSNTQRAYWKEAQRFYLWLLLVKHTGLSKIDRTGCLQYVEFLKHPPKHWCAARARNKNQHLWRPFENSLSLVARYRAIKVLRGLYTFLINRGDVAHNPWDELVACSAPKSGSATKREERRFDQVAWNIIHQELADMPKTSINLRLSVAVSLFHDTAIGIGKVVKIYPAHLCLDAEIINKNACPNKYFGSSQLLEVSPETISLLQAYFANRGLDPDLSASCNADVALLGRASDVIVSAPWVLCAQVPVDSKAGIGVGTLRDQLKQFFVACALRCQDKPDVAAQFTVATSHWLRRKPVGGKLA